MTEKLPLSVEDLRHIAEMLEAYQKAIDHSDGLLLNLGAAEVRDPEDYATIWGHIVSCDDWYGFRPLAQKLLEDQQKNGNDRISNND